MPFAIRKTPLPSLFLGLALAAGGLSGCLGSDTTAAASNAKINLTSPQGNENFKIGDTLWFKWTVKDDPSDPVDAVDPKLSIDSGKTWTALRQSITPAMSFWGKYGWKIPDSLAILGVKQPLAGKTQCLARVEQYTTADPLKKSTTPKTFTISAAP